MASGRAAVLGTAFVAILAALTLALLELAAHFLVPPWPYRVLRPHAFPRMEPPPGSVETVLDPAFRWGAYQMNSWGMRDFERSLEKPPGRYRILLVGDSFLEGGFVRVSLPVLVQARLHEQGDDRTESVNLGVNGTGLRHYYFRLRELAPALAPDAVFLFVYSGNDYLAPVRSFRGRYTNPINKLVEELPRPSVLGSLTPRFTWLLVNRLEYSEIGRGITTIPNEMEDLDRYLAMPFEMGIEHVTDHVHRHYHPEVKRERLREILGRGGPAFWEVLRNDGPDAERLQGWILNTMVQGELDAPEVPDPEESRLRDEGMVRATLSWVEATQRLCDDAGIPLVVFVIPVGIVDPAFPRFWEPWPAWLEWNQHQDRMHRKFVDALERTPIRAVDLAEVFDGAEGNYRVTDGHWNTRGTQLASDVVLREIARLAPRESR